MKYYLSSSQQIILFKLWRLIIFLKNPEMASSYEIISLKILAAKLEIKLINAKNYSFQLYPFSSCCSTQLNPPSINSFSGSKPIWFAQCCQQIISTFFIKFIGLINFLKFHITTVGKWYGQEIIKMEKKIFLKTYFALWQKSFTSKALRQGSKSEKSICYTF